MSAAETVADWNRRYKPGQPVRVKPWKGERVAVDTRTASLAGIFRDDAGLYAGVAVACQPAGAHVPLSRIEVL